MKNLRRGKLIALALVVIPFMLCQSLSQPYEWETITTLDEIDDNYTTKSTFCDNYGLNVVAGLLSTGNSIHLLFGNDGSQIGSTYTFESSSPISSITGFNGVLYVATDVDDDIKLYVRDSPGEEWSTFTYFPSTGITVNHLDIHVDVNGVHIVWDNIANDEIYYVRYDLVEEGFDLFRNVTNIDSPDEGMRPKVTSSGSEIHVSFIKVDEDPAVGASLDLDFSGMTPTWDNDYELIPEPTGGEPAAQQSTAVLDDDLFMVMSAEAMGSGEDIYAVSRQVDGDWSGSLTTLHEVYLESENFRRRVVNSDGILHAVYARAAGSSPRGILLKTYDGGWSSAFEIETYSGSPISRWPEIAASRTGVYCFWNRATNLAALFRRKVLPISGSINSEMWWTGNNWIDGNATIEDGVTVSIKDGAHLTIESGVTLTVDDGGRLIIEDGAVVEIEATGMLKVDVGGVLTFENGADIVMGSNGKLILETSTGTGGVLELADGATLPVDAGGKFEAKAGSEIRAGHNAEIRVSGEFKATGTNTNETLLTRLESSDTWKGIVGVSTGSSPDVTIAYSRIEYCLTAVKMGVNGSLSISNSILDSPLTGIEFTTSASSPEQSYIQNNTFSNIGSVGILVNSLSLLTIDGNTLDEALLAEGPTAGIVCSGASPEILANIITDFDYGVRCLAASSPVFEDADLGGYNDIKNVTYGVYAKDGSNPVVGDVDGSDPDDGGQNCIDGLTYDVQLVNGCNVQAENNYWGSSQVFSVPGGNVLDYTPSLTSCPMESRSGGGSPFMNPGTEGFEDAIALYTRGNFSEAILLLKEIVEDNRIGIRERESAVSYLLACSQNIRSSGTSAYLEEARIDYSSLSRTIDFVLPQAYLNEGLIEDATDAFALNIRTYPESELELNGLYNMFNIALYVDGDTTQAEGFLASLENSYEEEIETIIARRQWEEFTNTMLAESMAPGGNGSQLVTEGLPGEFKLSQNYPNPFNPSTTIKYALPKDVYVRLKIFDVLGREVVTLVDDIKQAGYHEAIFDASSIASGLYFYTIVAGEFNDTKKMMVVK